MSEMTNSNEQASITEEDYKGMPGVVVIQASFDKTFEMTREKVLKSMTPSRDAVYRKSGALMRIGEDDNGQPVLKAVGSAGLELWLSDHAEWQRYLKTQDKMKEVRPDRDVVRVMLEQADRLSEVPRLKQIVRCPVFAPDGTLIDQPGYSPSGELWYEPLPGLKVPSVSVNPTPNEIAEAVRLLIHELLIDFPFATGADRANILSFLLEPIVRPMITGPTPLHANDAASVGSGKTLLTQIGSIITMGQPVPFSTFPHDEAEVRKELHSLLLAGRPLVCFDNQIGRVNSGSLAGVITTPPGTWSQRVLGFTQQLELDVRCTWVITGNNLDLSLEMARRTVRSRLDPNVEMPWRGRTFKHDPLIPWVQEHRGELLWACLTIVRAWQAKGSPAWSGTPLGGFEEWSRIMGGIVETMGSREFLGNQEAVWEDVASEINEWQIFVEAWWQRYGSNPVRSGELLALALQLEDDPIGASGLKDQRLFGYWLRDRKDRVIGEWKIIKDGKRWRLRR